MDYYYLLLIVIAYIIYKYFARNVNYWRIRGVKGPKPMPLFGNFLDNFQTPITILELKRSKKYGKIYGFLDMTQPVISISDIELIKLITMKDFQCFPNHQNMTPGDPLLSKMLVNLVDDEWRRVRNMCVPAFTAVRVKQMFPAINKCVDNAIAYFDDLESKKLEIELKRTLTIYACDVLASTVFGLEVNSFENPDGDFCRHALSVTDMTRWRVVFGALMPGQLRQMLGFTLFEPSSVEYFKSLLNYVIEKRREKDTNHSDLLQILLSAENDGNDHNFGVTIKDKQKMGDEELIANCLLMLMAATETTSSALMYTVYALAMNDRVQNKLFDELKVYIESNSYDYDTLLSLPYLEAVINETLRRYTPAVHMDRVAGCDYKLGDTGITIEKGTVVNLPFHAIHHDPDYWPEPYEYRPERFLPENKSNLVPYTFAPFGYGPRSCLAMKLAYMEMKIMVSRFFYRFQVIRTDKTPLEPKYNSKKFNNQCEPIFVAIKRREK